MQKETFTQYALFKKCRVYNGEKYNKGNTKECTIKLLSVVITSWNFRIIVSTFWASEISQECLELKILIFAEMWKHLGTLIVAKPDKMFYWDLNLGTLWECMEIQWDSIGGKIASTRFLLFLQPGSSIWLYLRL